MLFSVTKVLTQYQCIEFFIRALKDMHCRFVITTIYPLFGASSLRFHVIIHRNTKVVIMRRRRCAFIFTFIGPTYKRVTGRLEIVSHKRAERFFPKSSLLKQLFIRSSLSVSPVRRPLCVCIPMSGRFICLSSFTYI